MVLFAFGWYDIYNTSAMKESAALIAGIIVLFIGVGFIWNMLAGLKESNLIMFIFAIIGIIVLFIAFIAILIVFNKRNK